MDPSATGKRPSFDQDVMELLNNSQFPKGYQHSPLRIASPASAELTRQSSPACMGDPGPLAKSTSPPSNSIRHATRHHRRTHSDPMDLSTVVLLAPALRSERINAMSETTSGDDSMRPWHEDKARLQRALARREDFNHRRNSPSPLSSVNASRCASPDLVQ